MSSIRFVRDSGICIADSGSRPVNYSQHRGQTFPRGQVCTACLVGTWPQTLLHSQQYLCGSCQHLGKTIATLEQATWTLGGQDDVRQLARNLRAESLTNLFDEAAAVGTTVSTTPDGDREISYANYLAQVGDGSSSRARRFAAWMRAVAPDLAAARAAPLADVDYLTAEMDRHHRRVLRGQARVRVERARNDIRLGVHGFGTATPAVLRALLSRRA